MQQDNNIDNSGLMTTGEHLEELRKMLFRIIGVMVCATAIIFCFKDTTFDILLAPLSSDFVTFRIINQIAATLGVDMMHNEYNIKLISTDLAAQFMTHITTSCYLAFMLTLPYILVELFIYISPALYEHEKRYSGLVTIIIYGLFSLGLLISYFVIFPVSFLFLATYQVDTSIENTITLTSYISTFTTLTLMMGIVFQLPVIVFTLAKIGLVDASLLKNFRRHAIIVIAVIAAVITPTSDIFTLTIVMLPIYALYEMSIFAIRGIKINEVNSDNGEEELSL